MRPAVWIFLAVLLAACSLSTNEGVIPSPVPPTNPPTKSVTTVSGTPAQNAQTPSQPPARVTVQVVSTVLPAANPTVAIRFPIPATVLPEQLAVVASSSVDPKVRGIVLSSSGAHGEIALSGDAINVAYNPVDPTHYARVDTNGGLHFAPLGGGEGVYSFAPYFDGFSAPSAQQNKLFVAEIQWSPSGEMLAFRIASGDPAANDGVWFWQPARETATDPSYHLLRDCPPGCGLVTPVNAAQWRSKAFEWSSDNQAILVELDLPQEKRGGIAVVQAVRDPQTRQSRTGPTVLRYDYGHWASDGQHIVVSGKDPNGQIVFGTVGRDGSGAVVTPAATIGLAWVQDAVQQPDTGALIMLGSPTPNGPLRLYDASGKALSGDIGATVPSTVSWSPDRKAALVVVGEAGQSASAPAQYFFVKANGSVTDITSEIAGTKAINWVPGALPAGTNAFKPAIPTGVVAGSLYQPGQQLRVATDRLDVYAEPSRSSSLLGSSKPGTYVAILAGPYGDGSVVWWQVQTASGLVGWAAGEVSGVTTLAP
jgi:hypothetical protein